MNRRLSITHHDTRSSTTAEVQLAIHVSNIVSHRPHWPVERYYIAEVVEQLRSQFGVSKCRVRVTRVRSLHLCR